jgi:exopolyphosphatase/guanosine-5'-triphosphate,3'-diphosphate pyrophosphatase
MGRAATLGAALRLAYVLSAGTPELLADAVLRLDGSRLILRLIGAGVFEGEGVQRRLDHLAATLGVIAALE